MVIWQPSIVFAARVNMASATYPLDEITYDGVTTGVYSNIFPGMTVLLGSAAGLDDYGRQRVRKAATSTLLRVGRSSRGTRDGELDITDNAYITVLREWRVWAKIPYIDPDGEIFKDSDVGATGEAPDPHPVAVASPAFAGTADAGTGVATVEFDASDSFQFDAAVSSALSGVASYLWEMDAGTITVGTISSAAITVEFPPGSHYVYLTVVGDNGQMHQTYRPVYVRDPDDDDSISDYQIASHRITPQGQGVSVRVLQDIPRATYRDGSLVMIWDDDLQSEDVSRPHMLFVGWHQTDNGGVRSERTGNVGETVLNLVDVAGRLKTLPGFPQRMENGSPTAWQYTRYPNVLYYLHYLLYWHSTALEVADLLLGTQTLNNFAFKVLSSDGGNLYDQVNSLANNITPDHHLTCNRQGQLMLVVDPMIQIVDDRSATIADYLDASDWTELRYTGNRPPRIYQLRSYAVSGGESSIVPLAALAPGEAPGQGEQYIETSERITFSQFDLNNVEGNRYARLNAPFGPFVITAPYERLDNGFDPAHMQWLNVDFGEQPQRGYPASNDRGLVQEITIAYDYQRTGLVRTATITWELETFGPPAITLELEPEEGA